MKDCEGVRELLSHFAEGELQPEEVRRVERHLEECSECREERELLNLTVATLRDLPDLPAPAGILHGVRERLEPRPWYRRLGALLFPAGSRRAPLGALASVLVAFGIFLVYDRHPEIGKAPVLTPPAGERVSPVPEKTEEKEAKTAPALSREVEAGHGERAEQDRYAPPDRKAPEERAPADELPVPSAPAEDLDASTFVARVEQEAPPAPKPPELAERGRPGADAAAEEGFPESEVAVPPVPEVSSPLRLPPRPPAAPEPVAPPAARIVIPREPPETSGLEESVPPPAGEAVKELARQEARENAGRYRAERDRTAGPEGIASFATPSDDLRNKALPPAAPEKKVMVDLTGRLSASREDTFAREEAEPRVSALDVTEVLTVVSLDGEVIDRLRERLREAGGRMLELRTLDTLTSQQLALPYLGQIPARQVVSRGWQIRAAVPRSSVDDFIASFGERSSLQILHRTTEPLSWSQERGLQNFEINVLR